MPCAIAAYFAATLLLYEAGLGDPFESLAACLVLFMCLIGIERLLSFTVSNVNYPDRSATIRLTG